MNILLESRAFYPSVGGLEMMAEELACAWQQRGHEIKLITSTPIDHEPELEKLEIHRCPSIGRVQDLTRWSDVFFQNGVSLRSFLYPIMLQRPLVIRHPNILAPTEKNESWVLNGLKRTATRFAYNVASCKAVGASVPGQKTIIPNTLRPAFRNSQPASRERQGLLFVGRLVSFKGCDIALRALRLLHDWGVEETLTLCGGGSDLDALKQQASVLGLREHVQFMGWTSSDELINLYQEAAVTLVPSRYEPFGIVALEAIACGSPVVASNTGGLPEAVGPCGLLAEPENVGDLARKTLIALDPSVKKALMAHASDHIAKHDRERISQRYLKVLEAAVNHEPIPDPV